MREDDVDPGHLASVADHLTQEPSVMRDDLEIEIPYEQDLRRPERPVRAEREDRVALHLLDLQGR